MSETCANCDRPLPSGEIVCPVCCPPPLGPQVDPLIRAEIDRQLRQAAAGTLLGTAFKHPFSSGSLREAERLYEASGADDPGLKRRIERAKALQGFILTLVLLALAALIFSMLRSAP